MLKIPVTLITQENFGVFFSKLGPRRSAQIRIKVYGNDNILTTHLKTLLDKWGSEFSTLYNKPENNESDDNIEFYRNIMNLKQFREAQMENPLFEENPELNVPISFDEIEKIINKLKINKSSGIDQIPNEVLKNHDAMLPLYNLFIKCFVLGIVPTMWLKALILAVPKSASKDPYVPLNYRGISLLSCVSKVFSGLINNCVIL